MHNERGQTIVIVALLIVALLVVLGLAIDGGMMIVERRRMQNSADAGSLAGAHRLISSICGSESASTADAAIWAEVVEYARRNGVEETSRISAQYVKFDGNTVVAYDPPVLVGGGLVPNGAVGVAADVGIERQTYFLGLIGIDTGSASAEATAVTGPPLAAGGMRPFGVPVEVVGALDPDAGDCFTSNFKNCDVDTPNDCWIKDDNGDVIGHHRNWLNLNHMWNCTEAPDFPRANGDGGSAADLMEWMANGFDGTIYADCYWSDGCGCGDFIHAKPGTDSSAIGSTPIDVVFTIPIFDVLPHYDQIQVITPTLKAGPVPQGGDYYYHIVGFASVVVEELADADQGAGTIKACLTEIVWGSSPPKPNSGYGADVCAGGTMVVTLWE